MPVWFTVTDCNILNLIELPYFLSWSLLCKLSWLDGIVNETLVGESSNVELFSEKGKYDLRKKDLWSRQQLDHWSTDV